MFKTFITALFVLLISACSTTQTYAPVIEASRIENIPKSGAYKVNRGDTLYSIAWRYGLDYHQVAKQNHLKSPYILVTGQSLNLRNGPAMLPSARSASTTIAYSQVHASNWMKPAHGNVISKFGANNRGVNIAGHYGEPVYASHAGLVVYSGSGLRGYGRLIILKHNNEFMSAYAHNASILVKEGDQVKQGQQIASMGNSDSNQTMLHFEIRQKGKPVNPMSFIRF